MSLISVEKASQFIQEQTLNLAIVCLDFRKTAGRVLVEDVLADRDFPPFDRVTMDGFALVSKKYEEGQRTFKIQDVQFAGEAKKTLKNAEECIEVMTGSPLPEGCDSVIRYEDASSENGFVTFNHELETKKNIHAQGSDRLKNAVVLPQGHLLKSADLAVLATVGKQNVWVRVLPKVAIITSGDELVNVNEKPLAHQIRKSNVFAISNLIEPFSQELAHFHLADDLEESISKLDCIFADFDVLILSGGVSAGKKDFIPEALDKLGVEKLFHKIAQRPGKPMWFGKRAEKLVFALPGNPVSAFMCAVRYVKPWFQQNCGITPCQGFAVLNRDITFKPELTYFMQVKLFSEKATLFAEPVEGHGSGDLANLSDADAFMELPAQKDEVYKKGSIFQFWRF